MAEVIAIDQGRADREERNRPKPSIAWTQLTGTARILRSKGIIREHLRIIRELDPAEQTKFIAQLAGECQP